MVFNTKETLIVATTGCLNTDKDSLESIIAGSEAGAMGCQIALDMSADGIGVLCSHGGYILSDGSSIALEENTYEDVRHVHLKVVTIGQAIELAKSFSSKVCIELKNTALCAQTKLALTHADYIDETYFVGVPLNEACRLAKAQPQLHIMADVRTPVANEGGLVRAAQDGGLFGLRVAPAVLTPSLISEAHHVGLLIATTETSDENELQRLIELNVNFIESSQPDAAYNLLPKPEEDGQLSI